MGRDEDNVQVYKYIIDEGRRSENRLASWGLMTIDLEAFRLLSKKKRALLHEFSLKWKFEHKWMSIAPSVRVIKATY